MTLENFGLYWAKVEWDEGIFEEDRPVLVVANKVYVFYALTKNIERKNGYVIKNWEKYGLSYPSLIRFDKKVNLTEDKVGTKIGVLGKEDIDGFSNALEDYLRNRLFSSSKSKTRTTKKQ